jgi:hypothetical protein
MAERMNRRDLPATINGEAIESSTRCGERLLSLLLILCVEGSERKENICLAQIR